VAGEGPVLAQAPQAAVSEAEQASRQAESLRGQQELKQQAQDQQAKNAPAEDEPPETYPGENDDLGPQKILKQKKKKPLFEFSSDTMFTWTSNALLQAKHPGEGRLVAETASLTFAPEPLDIGIGKLGYRGGYRHLFFVYDVFGGPLNKSNFEMSTFFSGVSLNFLEKWNASLGMDYNRVLLSNKWDREYLLDPSKWREGFVDWSPNWSLMRSVSFTDKLNLILGYSGAYHFTETDPLQGPANSNDKLDSTVMASLMWSVSPKWMLQPAVRFTHALYTQHLRDSVHKLDIHRRDKTFSPSVSLIWNPGPRFSVRTSVGGEFRKSNLNDGSAPDYSKFEASVGVTALFKF
jgi:outer membrane receptor protein involved in Fe transport